MNIKKIFLSFLMIILPILASAETVEIDGIWYNLVIKAKEAEVTRNPSVDSWVGSYSGKIDIPAFVMHEGRTYSVTSIGNYAFRYCGGLTSIAIPNSVTFIGRNAFGDCFNLTSVHISDLASWCQIVFEFEEAGGYDSNPLVSAHHLFIDGEEIKDLIIPTTIISINNGAFNGGSSFSSVVIPNSVTSIGERAFSGSNNLTSVTIPNSVMSIGGSAFWGCSNLISVTIPNSVTSIGESAFWGCSNLISVTIPNSVTSIGGYAFWGCSSLTSVTIPNSVTSIGEAAFWGCSCLTSFTIPNSVTSIQYDTFQDCSGLTSVTIPICVTSIGNRAFSGCNGLTSITIPNSVMRIGKQAFANCDELTDVYCLAKKLRNEEWSGEGLYTNPDAFMNSYPQYISLHVPAASIEAYHSMEPWSKFKTLVALEDDDTPTTQKCANPEISYANGKVSLSCETEGVDFISEVTVADAKKYYNSEFTLSQTYKISVYATKAGYEKSDVATREIVIENGQTSLFGDINKDGKVNVTDVVRLIDIIMNE